MTTNHKFSIYNGQYSFKLKGKKVANVITYELYEVLEDEEELIDYIKGYTDG